MGRVLWITPKWLLPADDGAKVATRALLSNLPIRDNVDVLALAGDDEVCDTNELKQLYGITGKVTVMRRQAVGKGLSRHIRNVKRMVLNPSMPATVSRYGTPQLQSRFKEILGADNYSHIVLDGLHVAALSSKGNTFTKPDGVKLVYRAHNVEWQIWQRAAENASAALRPVLNRQFNLMREFEMSVVRQADLVAPVSEEDSAVFRQEFPEGNITTIPIGLSFSDSPPPLPDGPITLGYIGRLDWSPNKDGLKWFLDNVWPSVRSSDIKLNIAGSGDDSWLLPMLERSNIDYVGRVDNVADFYSSCHAAIVPIFYGSGTRLKMIEPASYGRPCISTEAGALGSTLEPGDYIAAESAADWIDTINSLTNETCNTVGSNARTKLQTTFDQQTIASQFASHLQTL